MKLFGMILNGYVICKSKHNSEEIVKHIDKILNKSIDNDRQKISNSINAFSGEKIGYKLNNLFSEF